MSDRIYAKNLEIYLRLQNAFSFIQQNYNENSSLLWYAGYNRRLFIGGRRIYGFRNKSPHIPLKGKFIACVLINSGPQRDGDHDLPLSRRSHRSTSLQLCSFFVTQSQYCSRCGCLHRTQTHPIPNSFLKLPLASSAYFPSFLQRQPQNAGRQVICIFFFTQAIR